MQGLRHELWTFCKAQFSALVATLADFALAILLAEVCGLWYVGATFSGAVVGGIVNCCINYKWVFDNTHQMQKKGVAIRYLLVWCGSILLNTGGTYLLTESSGQHFIFAKAIVAICIAVLWNYQLQRNFVYKLKAKTKMNYRDSLQKIIYHVIDPFIRQMIKMGITPNVITAAGFVGNILALRAFVGSALDFGNNSDEAYAPIGWGGLIILIAGLFDMIDGRLARMGHMSSKFGALWDSTLDRYSELVTLFGISLIFIKADWFWMGVVTFAAMVGSVMVSYVRARAEGIGIECKVGLMQRPERVVITGVTAIIAGLTKELWWLAGGMIIIAILANVTAFWRIEHCYKELENEE